MKIYCNNRFKTDVNFHLIHETKSRVRQALKWKSKSIATIEVLGIDFDTHRE